MTYLQKVFENWILGSLCKEKAFLIAKA